uniref:Uncharacterized protein n=1 Tax=viral metagenome TaxID=1070528 RepID=A0A6M3L1V3_9ZZZZ
MSYSPLFDHKVLFNHANMMPDANGNYLLRYQTKQIPWEFAVWLPPGSMRININFFAGAPACVGLVSKFGSPPTTDYSQVNYPYWHCFPWDRDSGRLDNMVTADNRFKNIGGHGFVLADYKRDGLSNGEWLYLKKLDVDTKWNMDSFEYAVIVKGQPYRDWFDLGAKTTQLFSSTTLTNVWTPTPGCTPQTGQDPAEPDEPVKPVNPIGDWPWPITDPVTALAAKKGDIIFQVTERVNPGEPGALQQYYKAFSQEILWASGVYEGFYNQYTYDDTDNYFNDGVSRYWFHCEIATEDMKTLPAKAGVRYVVCRLTTEMQKSVDVLVAATMYKVISSGPDFRYGQPFFAAFLRWVQTLAPDHFDGLPILRGRILSMFGINIMSYDFKRFQYSPTVSDLAYTDLHDDEFWDRDFDCSSLTLWSLVHGWNVKTNGQVRPMFLGHYQYVAAVDCAAPGLLAAWLIENGMADVI